MCRLDIGALQRALLVNCLSLMAILYREMLMSTKSISCLGFSISYLIPFPLYICSYENFDGLPRKHLP